jgi:hypothetical protein
MTMMLELQPEVETEGAASPEVVEISTFARLDEDGWLTVVLVG